MSDAGTQAHSDNWPDPSPDVFGNLIGDVTVGAARWFAYLRPKPGQ